MADLPTSASIVVIGGGVIGTSILFHLAEAGVTDAVLVDKGPLGAGSTSRAAGGVRAQFSDELNVRIAQRSLDAWEDFGRRPGWEIDLKQVGYLFLLTREEDVATFERSIAIQNGVGVGSELVDVADIAKLCPLAATDDVIAAAWHERDGHCTPEGAVQGYATGARSFGAQLFTGAEVVGIDPDGVRLKDGRAIATDTVICAAGAWSGVVAELAGVSLPVVPLKRQIIFTEPLADLPREIPFTIDFSTTFYFHREGPGVLMGMSYTGERPGFDTQQTDDWLPDLQAAMARRVPRLVDAGIQGGWGGLYEVTPDHNALIGEVEPDAERRPSRFLYATGFSGHGFLQAPGVGEIVRDLVLGEEPFVDVSELSAVRFSSDALRPEHNIV